MNADALGVGVTPGYHDVELQSVDAQGKLSLRIAHVCDLCGQERHPGDWPDCRRSGNHLPGNFGEEPLEAYDDKNLAPATVRITTRAQRRRIMAKNHLEYVPKGERKGARTYFDMKKG